MSTEKNDVTDSEFSDSLVGETTEIEDIPKDERVLRTQAYDKSVADLVAMIKQDEIVLTPEYQRSYVWDDTRASLLVESVLLNVPIPVVYVAEEDDGRWTVVDGLQRLNSLARFLNNEFELRGLEVLPELNKSRFHQLNPKASRILKNGIIRVILIFKESHPEIKYEIFMRLNRGAITLTEQELRNCLYRGAFNSLLHELRADESVKTMFRRDSIHKRMGDAELILRSLMVMEGFDPATGSVPTYSGNMKSSLNRFMRSKQHAKPEVIDKMRSDFLCCVDKILTVFGDDALQRVDEAGDYDGRLNRALMEAFMASFLRFDRDILVKHKKEIRKKLVSILLNDEGFTDSITVRTSEAKKMDRRVSGVFTLVSDVVNTVSR